MKRIKILLFMAMLIAFVSGCSSRADREEIRESLDGNQGQSDADAEKDAGSDNYNAEGSGIPDHISYTSEDGNCVIEADVMAEVYQGIGVYDVKKENISNELVRRYADSMFDNGEYELIKPYDMYSFDELKAEEEFFLTIAPVDDALYSWWGVNNLDPVMSAIDNYSDENIADIPEDMLCYESPVNFGLTLNCLSRIRGKINGVWYELYFCEYDNNLQLEVHNLEDACCHLCGKHSINDMAEAEHGKNSSDLSECEQAAEEFVGKMGYDDMFIAYETHLIYEEENIESDNINDYSSYLDGYRFVFSRKKDIQVGYAGPTTVRAEDDAQGSSGYTGYDPSAMQEYVFVEVIDGEVTGVRVDNVYEIGECLSDNATLLSFDKVDTMAKNILEQKEYEVKVDLIELRYLVIPCGEFKYSLMPVWIYSSSYEEYGQKNPELGINAVDGRIIVFDGNQGSLFMSY